MQTESKTQHLWIEINREWLIDHNLYKPPPRTSEEADIMLRLLIHYCRAIKRPTPLETAALAFGAKLVKDTANV
ncbi:hypothetical protein ES707_00126 [subsurface metagenome]